MLDVSQEFLEALEANEVQHIFGQINLKRGKTIYLDEKVLVGSPSYTKQCTSVADEFGIGQLYTGTAKITVYLPDIRNEDLRGASLSLRFKAGSAELISLGMWTITDPQRDSSGYINITASDCIAKLDVPININYVGAITLESRMKKVTELTGVVFAQTPKEIYNLIGGMSLYLGTTFCKTCRAEVIAIAQLMGGLAFADRDGCIAFRKIGTEPVLTIKADRRHSIKLSEYTFGIRGVAYDNGYGHTTIMPFGDDKEIPNTSAIITLSGNPYMGVMPTQDDDEIDRQTKMYLEPIAANLNIPIWTPGEIEYYGNPALDLGDVVKIEGGINGDEETYFIITADHWRFRGPQTLISAGAAENNLTIAASTGKSQTQQMITTVNITKRIVAVELKSYPGILTEKLRQAAFGGFSCREETVVFVDITANIRGKKRSEVKINVLFDGVKQTVNSVDTVGENDAVTVHFSLNITASSGIHSVAAEASGIAEIERISAVVWGQNIVGEQAVPTDSDDYIYTVSGRTARITEYIGNSKKPSVPDTLGGASVRSIGKRAFIDSDVEFVYIPDGVTEIE